MTTDQLMAARQVVADYRARCGFKRAYAPILQTSTPDDPANVKLGKSKALTLSLTLLQHRLSGYNVCPYSTPECRRYCVMDQGKGMYDSVQRGRLWRTLLKHEQPAIFRLIVLDELHRGRRKAERLGLDCLARLNTGSDVRWEHEAPEWFIDGIDFYDYTKWPVDKRPDPVGINYRLTRSATERTTAADVRRMVEAGSNVAVVLRERTQKWAPEKVPTVWAGLPAVNGDLSDNRHADPRGRVILLGAKGSIARSPMAKALV